MHESHLQVNHVDVASNYAGILMAITNTIGNVCGFLAPYIIGVIVTTEVYFSFINLRAEFSFIDFLEFSPSFFSGISVSVANRVLYNSWNLHFYQSSFCYIWHGQGTVMESSGKPKTC